MHRVLAHNVFMACPAEASARQTHHPDGSITLYVDAVLHAPAEGLTGALAVASEDESSWAGSSNVETTRAGANFVTVEVGLTLLACPYTVQIHVLHSAMFESCDYTTLLMPCVKTVFKV
jgi:hypothetical protein